MANLEPGIFDRGALSFMCYEDAFPQEAWERKRKMRNAKELPKPAMLPITSKIKEASQWVAKHNSVKVERNQSGNNTPPPPPSSSGSDIPPPPPLSSRNRSGNNIPSPPPLSSKNQSGSNIPPPPPLNCWNQSGSNIPPPPPLNCWNQSGNSTSPLPLFSSGSESDTVSTPPSAVHNQHYAHLGHYIRDKFHKQQICDMAFKVGEKIIPVHRIVLGSQSPFFASIFERDSFSQEAVAPKIIKVRGVSEESVMLFLEFLYSGNISIKTTVIADLLKLARVFHVQKIQRLCLNQVKEANNEELLNILPIVKGIEEIEYCDNIMKVIGKNFLDVKESTSFFNLDIDTLCMILSHDTLTTKSELDVFYSAISWMHHHDFENRIRHLEKLMRCVRFPLMSKKELFRCFKMFPALRNEPKCVEMITMANW
ncbi:kelch-like protein 7 [Saccostrea echinata]|uniref:kelch-like protein 7 n=1 Tax=Saccostrea echinata TaxID=191078 RepID=UPI002A839F0A|nr:kelch-like protein 7 [Saccostrea echinata]